MGTIVLPIRWHQIDNHLSTYDKTILDIGSGFGLSSIEYARRGCQVTAIEPTPEMVTIAQEAAKREELNIKFHTATLQSVDHLADNYDLILCHNILEYTEDPREFLINISQKQNTNGMLSLITHNPTAKVMKKAIINKDPQGAQASIGNTQEYSGIIQTDITIYPLEQLVEWLADCGYEVRNTYGIHNIYGYITDNELKLDEAWHAQMLNLEFTLGSLSPYKEIAVFSHIIAEKKS